MGLNPTRTAMLDVARRAGAVIETTLETSSEGEAAGEPVGRLRVRYGTPRSFEITPAEVPLADRRNPRPRRARGDAARRRGDERAWRGGAARQGKRPHHLPRRRISRDGQRHRGIPGRLPPDRAAAHRRVGECRRRSSARHGVRAGGHARRGPDDDPRRFVGRTSRTRGSSTRSSGSRGDPRQDLSRRFHGRGQDHRRAGRWRDGWGGVPRTSTN